MADAVVQAGLFDSGGTTNSPSASCVLITAGQLARAFGVAPSTISRWPLTVVERRGREVFYDLAEAVALRVGELGRLDLADERARLARVQRERQELLLAKERGELIPAEDVQKVWEQYIGYARARLLALPETASARVAGATVTEAVGILRDLVFDALRELAAYDPEAYAGSPPAAEVPDHGNEATTDPEEAPPRPAGRRSRGRAADCGPAPGEGEPDRQPTPVITADELKVPPSADTSSSVASSSTRRRRAAGSAESATMGTNAATEPLRRRHQADAGDRD